MIRKPLQNNKTSLFPLQAWLAFEDSAFGEGSPLLWLWHFYFADMKSWSLLKHTKANYSRCGVFSSPLESLIPLMHGMFKATSLRCRSYRGRLPCKGKVWSTRGPCNHVLRELLHKLMEWKDVKVWSIDEKMLFRLLRCLLCNPGSGSQVCEWNGRAASLVPISSRSKRTILNRSWPTFEFFQSSPTPELRIERCRIWCWPSSFLRAEFNYTDLQSFLPKLCPFHEVLQIIALRFCRRMDYCLVEVIECENRGTWQSDLLKSSSSSWTTRRCCHPAFAQSMADGSQTLTKLLTRVAGSKYFKLWHNDSC